MIRKRFLGLTLAAFTALGTAQAGTEIRFDGFPDFDSSLKKILPEFKKVQPDIEVKYLMNNWGDHHNKLTTNLATGSGAGDVVVVDVAKIGAFAQSGGLVDLSATFNADQYKDQFPAYAWAQGQDTNGHQFGMPVDLGPGVMYYRNDIAEQMGVNIKDVIKSWDSYIEYGKKLKEKNIYLIASAADVAEAILTTTVEEGNGVFFDANGKPLLTSPRFIRAFETAKKIRDLGLDARISAWTNEWYEGFKSGSVATQLSGAWLLGHLKNWIAPQTAGKWRVSNLPDGIYGSWGGSFLAIPKQSAHKKEAWELIKFMTLNQDIQKLAFRTIAAFPANVNTYNDPMFDEPVEFLGGQKARRLFAEIAAKVKPVKPAKGDHIARSIVMDNALMEVLDNGRDIREALEDAERLLKRRLRTL